MRLVSSTDPRRRCALPAACPDRLTLSDVRTILLVPRSMDGARGVGNFAVLPASNSMSSLSDAQFEADFPPAGGRVREPAGEESAGELMTRAQSCDRGAYGQMVVLYQHRLF